MEILQSPLRCIGNHQKAPEYISISDKGIGQIECSKCIIDNSYVPRELVSLADSRVETNEILKNWPPLEREQVQKLQDLEEETLQNSLNLKVSEILSKVQEIQKMLIQDIAEASKVVKNEYNSISSRKKLSISIQTLNQDPTALKCLVETKWKEKEANSLKIKAAFGKCDRCKNRIDALDNISEYLRTFDDQKQDSNEIGHWNLADKKESRQLNENTQQGEDQHAQKEEMSNVNNKISESDEQKESRILYEQLKLSQLKMEQEEAAEKLINTRQKIKKLEDNYGRILLQSKSFSWYVEDKIQKQLLEKANSKLMEITSNKYLKWSSIEEVFSGVIKGQKCACFQQGVRFNESQLSNEDKIKYLEEQRGKKNKTGWWFWIQLDEKNPQNCQYFYDYTLESFQDPNKNFTKCKVSDLRLQKAIDLASFISTQAEGSQGAYDESEDDDIDMC